MAVIQVAARVCFKLHRVGLDLWRGKQATCRLVVNHLGKAEGELPDGTAQFGMAPVQAHIGIVEARGHLWNAILKHGAVYRVGTPLVYSFEYESIVV